MARAWVAARLSASLAVNPSSRGTSAARPRAMTSNGSAGTRSSSIDGKKRASSGGVARARAFSAGSCAATRRSGSMPTSASSEGSTPTWSATARVSAWADDCVERRWHGTAHADRPVEQTTGLGRGEQRGAGDAAGRLPGDRDLARVAAERGDVVLHPVERGDPVVHGAVHGRAGDRQEPLGSEPVVDAHDHHAVTGEPVAPVPGAGVAPGREPATVDPHEHREPHAAEIRGEDVEVEALVAGQHGLGDDREGPVRLRRGRAVVDGIADAVPCRLGHGQPEPADAERCAGVRDAEERHGVVLRRSLGRVLWWWPLPDPCRAPLSAREPEPTSSRDAR